MFAAGYSMIQLDLGTFGRMGPGMFPMLVGICMFLLGVAVAVPALRRAPDERMQVDLEAAIFVLGSGPIDFR